ncbi:MAG: aldo/keto reductase [Ignavibacteriales bacterium]|nr:aldo/keto reductase [Ignavibacteriales bacterium]
MEFNLSRITLGLWRALEWKYSTNELDNLIAQSIELGITSFDHADIYGHYECEALFGNVLRADHSLRTKMQIATKCGIKITSPKFPEHTMHIYDTGKGHIIKSAENSLKNLATDYIDVLLIHRPDPLMNADEIAEAFYQLNKSGKVLNFGVSNFLPHQFKLLQSRLDLPLVTNQIEVSVLYHEHFDNGNIDFLQENRIAPMVWSPFAGGRIFSENSERANRVRNVLHELSEKYNVGIDAIAAAWLLFHPVNFVVVLGTGKIDRIKSAVKGLDVKLSREDWFKIWIAAKGHDIP